MLESPPAPGAESPGTTSPAPTAAPLTRRELRERLRLDEAARVGAPPAPVTAPPAPGLAPAATVAESPRPAPAHSAAPSAAAPAAPAPSPYPTRAELRRAAQAEAAAAPPVDAMAALFAGAYGVSGAAPAPAAPVAARPVAEPAARPVAEHPTAPQPSREASAEPAAPAEHPTSPSRGASDAARPVDDLAALFGGLGDTLDLDGAVRAAPEAPSRRPVRTAGVPRRPAGTPARALPTRALPTRPASSGATPTRGARVRRALVRFGTGVAATAFAVGLIVSSSVPASSLLSRADVDAMQAQAEFFAATGDAQSVDIAGGPIREVGREDYTSMTLMEYALAAGIKPAATFTNDPNGTIQWPFRVGVGITDTFGYRDCAGCTADHHGVDFVPGYGAEIQAIADGTVVYTEESEGSLGVHLIIEHEIDGEKIASVYAHMQYDSIRFAVGDTVHVGDIVGLVGNTGQSTGPHLHFEIRIGGMDGEWVDPLAWLYDNTN